MERTKKNKRPDAILMADIHLREDKPVCRSDNFWETQWIKLGFVKRLQEEYQCEVVNAGDLYNHWKPSPRLITETMKYLPKEFSTIYGQHDLPQHSLELASKCGVNTLVESGHLRLLPGGRHWGQEPDYKDVYHIPLPKGTGNWREILVWHYMTYKDSRPFPQHTGPSARRLLKKYPEYDLILTGDNHIPFVQEYEGRLLVNPGSMMRTTAKQIDHRPRVYLYYAESNTVKPVYLPIEKDVISREHIEVKEQRDERIDAFISKLDGDWEAAMSFEDNLKVFFKANKISENIQSIIYKAIES